VTAKYTQSSSGVSAEGLGFALPINDVKEIITDLIENGYVTGKPYMGVQVTSVPDYAQHYGVSAGAYVESVADGSCAQKAGLQADDIIIAIDDTAIDSSTALTAALSSGYKAGDTAKLTVLRGEDKMELTITFDEKNEQTEAPTNLSRSPTSRSSSSPPPAGPSAASSGDPCPAGRCLPLRARRGTYRSAAGPFRLNGGRLGGCTSDDVWRDGT